MECAKLRERKRVNTCTCGREFALSQLSHSGTHTYVEVGFVESHIESKSEGDHQQQREEEETAESVEDVNKHHDVDPRQRELADKDD